MKFVRSAYVFLFCAAISLAFAANSWCQVPSGKEVVTPEAVASYDPAAKGGSFEFAVVMKIRSGFHVNAREVSAEYLIPTDLKFDAPAGLKAGDVVYPKGTLQTFTFSKDKPLNVYTGIVVLRLPMHVLPTAAAGPLHVPLKLRYQACSDEVCLPPVTQTIDGVVNVTDNAGAARAVHSDLFPGRK